MKKQNHMGKKPRKVVAYEDGGIKVFDSAKEAAQCYGLKANTVYTLIGNGKECECGVSFDYQRWEE